MSAPDGRRRPRPPSLKSSEGSPTLPRQASVKHPKSPPQKIHPGGAILHEMSGSGSFTSAVDFQDQSKGLLALTSRAGLSPSAQAGETPKLYWRKMKKESDDKATEAAAARVAASSQFGWSIKNLYRQFFYPLLILPPIYTTNSEARRSRRVFEALGLTEREVAFLHQYYQLGDHFPSRRYFHRVFEMFDEDQSGTVDFREFVCAVWNYASMPNTSLIQFTFDLYDRDQSGILDASEVQRIIRDCYGSTLESNAAANAISSELAMAENMARDGFDVNSFSVFAVHHALLLMPAFTHQQRIRERLGGETFWRPATEKRLEISSGHYIPIQVLMKARLARSLSSTLSRIDTSTLLLDPKSARRASSPKIHTADDFGGPVTHDLSKSLPLDRDRSRTPPNHTGGASSREGRKTFPANERRRGSRDRVPLPVSPALMFMKTMHDTVASRRRIQVDQDDDDDLEVEQLDERSTTPSPTLQRTPTGAGGEKGQGQQRGQADKQGQADTRASRDKQQMALERSIRARDTAEHLLHGFVAKGAQY